MAADPEVKPTIVNIVSTVNLSCKLDLAQIALQARNAEYNPKRFSALIMRIREPKTTALIFSTGKMVCTGATTIDNSRLAARKYARILQKLGFDVAFTNFKIQNVVGSADVGFPIKLELLQVAHAPFAKYDPEIFPGMVYQMKKPTTVILLFLSGKMVIAGAKAPEDIFAAFNNIYPVVTQFRRMPRKVD